MQPADSQRFACVILSPRVVMPTGTGPPLDAKQSVTSASTQVLDRRCFLDAAERELADVVLNEEVAAQSRVDPQRDRTLLANAPHETPASEYAVRTEAASERTTSAIASVVRSASCAISRAVSESR